MIPLREHAKLLRAYSEALAGLSFRIDAATDAGDKQLAGELSMEWFKLHEKWPDIDNFFEHNLLPIAEKYPLPAEDVYGYLKHVKSGMFIKFHHDGITTPYAERNFHDADLLIEREAKSYIMDKDLYFHRTEFKHPGFSSTLVVDISEDEIIFVPCTIII